VDESDIRARQAIASGLVSEGALENSRAFF
jgi:hypothetical protein